MVRAFAPHLLIVALGLDASRDDPLACMEVTREGLARIGGTIGVRARKTSLPLIREGGYPSSELGTSLAAVLTGLNDAGRDE